jgi:hypothetical protein
VHGPFVPARGRSARPSGRPLHRRNHLRPRLRSQQRRQGHGRRLGRAGRAGRGLRGRQHGRRLHVRRRGADRRSQGRGTLLLAPALARRRRPPRRRSGPPSGRQGHGLAQLASRLPGSGPCRAPGRDDRSRERHGGSELHAGLFRRFAGRQDARLGLGGHHPSRVARAGRPSRAGGPRVREHGLREDLRGAPGGLHDTLRVRRSPHCLRAERPRRRRLCRVAQHPRRAGESGCRRALPGRRRRQVPGACPGRASGVRRRARGRRRQHRRSSPRRRSRPGREDPRRVVVR